MVDHCIRFARGYSRRLTVCSAVCNLVLRVPVRKFHNIQKNNCAVSCEIVKMEFRAERLSFASRSCAGDIYIRRNASLTVPITTAVHVISADILTTARMFRHASFRFVRNVEILLCTVSLRGNIKLWDKHHSVVIRSCEAAITLPRRHRTRRIKVTFFHTAPRCIRIKRRTARTSANSRNRFSCHRPRNQSVRVGLRR